MKNFFYIFCSIAALSIIGVLLYQRMAHTESKTAEETAQTVIPVAHNQQTNTADTTAYFDQENTESAIVLKSDETVVKTLSIDIDGDDREDQLVAARKLSEPFIYFIIFLQDIHTQVFIRTAEIKTTISQANTLTLYTLTVQGYYHPLIVYSGMSSESMQVFGIDSCTISRTGTLNVENIVQLSADGQILFKKDETSTDKSLNAYSISSYHADPAFPNTLNQIEKIYRWNEKKHRFMQTQEIKIPGKKIETQLLKKLQTGNTAVFKEFLNGLWYQPSSKERQNRSIFFSNSDNEIIFTINNIEEIFTVESLSPRRYGMYFSTKNASITSIRRRLDIELIGVDEINVRVIEDVARLKIGASSNWDGVYRKVRNSIQDTTRNGRSAEIKKILETEGKQWQGLDGSVLSFNGTRCTLTPSGQSIPDQDGSGRYALLTVKGYTILQIETFKQKNRFFAVTIDSGQDNKQKLLLTEVSITLAEIVPIGTPPLIFE